MAASLTSGEEAIADSVKREVVAEVQRMADAVDVPSVYRERVRGARAGELAPRVAGVLEEAADLCYQLIKLFSVVGSVLDERGAGLLQEELGDGALAASLSEAMEIAESLPPVAGCDRIEAVLVRAGLAPSAAAGWGRAFVVGQQVAWLARARRGSSGWQTPSFLRTKCLEEFAELAQCFAGEPSGSTLRPLARAMERALAGPDEVSSGDALATVAQCAAVVTGWKVSALQYIEYMHLKLLGRIEWNLAGRSEAEVKQGLKKAEALLLAVVMTECRATSLGEVRR